MKSFLPGARVLTPKDMDHALKILSDEPGVWSPIAGGTDIMVQFESGLIQNNKFLNIANIKDFKGIEETEDHIKIGALTTFFEISKNLAIRTEFPLLYKASEEIGTIAIQNRATLGGNIANASPVADSLPVLLVYDAEIELVSGTAARLVKVEDFFLGYKKMNMEKNELIKSVKLKKLKLTDKTELVYYYRKVGARLAQTISKVSIAALAKTVNDKVTDARIAFGSVAPVPVRCIKTESLLRKQIVNSNIIAQAKSKMLDEISPIDDIRSTAAYRKKVAENLLEEFLKKV